MRVSIHVAFSLSHIHIYILRVHRYIYIQNTYTYIIYIYFFFNPRRDKYTARERKQMCAYVCVRERIGENELNKRGS